jgi:hypothetical protein
MEYVTSDKTNELQCKSTASKFTVDALVTI